MSFLVQFTRLTTADKLSDRFLTSQVYNPSDPNQVNQGVLFSQIEILNPWFPTSQIGQTIINTTIREYYRGTNTSDLVNFENALKKVNQTLAQITQNGETDWIGNLNGVIALVNGKEIHFGQTGKSQAYLFRGGKINHITEGLMQNGEPHPLKTFSNITSGSLQLHDKILIANSIMFDHISLEDIRNVVSQYPPAMAAMELARILKQARIRNVNCIVAELVTPEDIATLPKEQRIDTVYLDQKIESPAIIGRRWFGNYLVPALSKAKSGLKSGIGWSSGKFRSVVKPGAEKLAGRAKDAASAGMTRLREKAENQPVETTSVTPAPVRAVPEIEKTNSVMVSHQNPPVAKLKFHQRLIRGLILFIEWLKPLIGLDRNPKHKPRRYIAFAIILVLVLGLTIMITRSNNPGLSGKEAKAKLTQLQEKKSEADIKVNFNDPQPAIALYAEVLNELTELDTTKSVQAEVEKLRKETNSKLEEVAGIKTIEGKQLTKIEGTKTVFNANGSLWAVTGTGQINKIQNPGGESQIIASLPANDDNLAGTTEVTDLQKIALVTDSPGVYLFDYASEKIVQAPGNATWAKSNLISSFVSNLYFITPNENQIVKYSYENEIYKEASPFLKTGSVSNAVSLAIDGSVYVLNSDGSVNRFDRGQVSSVKLANPPYKPTGLTPKQIITDADSSSIFVYSVGPGGEGNLIEYSKKGEYLKQYNLAGDSSNAIYLQIETKNRKAWTVNGNGQIAELSL